LASVSSIVFGKAYRTTVPSFFACLSRFLTLKPCATLPTQQLQDQHTSNYMPSRAALTIASAALLLVLVPLAAAHGEEHMDMKAPDAPQPQTQDGQLQTYWRLSEHAALMYWHIAFEILAWVGILPIGMFFNYNR
jgi:hypothetical protein